MITEHISTILYIVAPITGIVSLQFFIPKLFAKKVLNMDLQSGPPTFYFAHWGLVVCALAILLYLAAGNEALRTPVIAVTLMEKAALAIWVFADIKKPYTKKMLPAALFDAVVSVVFTLYLLGY